MAVALRPIPPAAIQSRSAVAASVAVGINHRLLASTKFDETDTPLRERARDEQGAQRPIY